MDDDYLIIVRRDESGQWVVDEDSVYVLEDEGSYSVLELHVSVIRVLERTLPDEWSLE